VDYNANFWFSSPLLTQTEQAKTDATITVPVKSNKKKVMLPLNKYTQQGLIFSNN
jgi:hypothetical protein